MKKSIILFTLIISTSLLFAKPKQKESHPILEDTPLFDISETPVSLSLTDFSFTEGDWFIKASDKVTRSDGRLVEIVEYDFSFSAGGDFYIKNCHAHSAMTFNNLSSEEAAMYKSVKDCFVDGKTVTLDSIYDEKEMNKKNSSKQVKDLVKLFKEIVESSQPEIELKTNESKTKFFYTLYTEKDDETETYYLIKK